MNARNLLTICVLFSVITLQGCATASGSVVLTGEVRVPVLPENVKLYLEPPKSYEVIGLINASSDAGWTEQGSQDYAVRELKEQAGKVGANGVLLTATGERTTTAIGGYGTGVLYTIPITAKTVQGKAIYVKSE